MTGRTGQLLPVVIVAIVVESGGHVAAAPVLAPVVRSYLRLFFALVLAGGVSGVAVKAFYSPSAIDIAVSLVSGAPAWVLSRRRVFRQLSEAGAPPTVETEPRCGDDAQALHQGRPADGVPRRDPRRDTAAARGL